MKNITFLSTMLFFYLFTQNNFAQNYTSLTSPLENKTSSLFESGGQVYAFPIDYDVDGDIDFISSTTTGSAWHLIKNNGGTYVEETGTTFNLTLGTVTGTTATEFIVIDYDNDGDQDIIDPFAGGDNDAAILRNDGSGVFTTLTAGGTSPLSGMSNSLFESGGEIYAFPIDYDVDGDIDFISSTTTGSGWHLIKNNAGTYVEETGTTFNLTLGTVTGTTATEFIVIDYDNDGDQDIIDPFAGGDSDAAILRNDGSGVFTTLTAGGTSPLSGMSNSLFESGGGVYAFPIDYDVDGDIDFISSTTTGSGWHLIRNNGGAYVEETAATIGLTLGTVTGTTATEFIVIDYDNDGDQDIIDPFAGGDDDAVIFNNTNSPPRLFSSIPTDGETMFNPSDDLVLTFNENISKGTGDIEIRRVSDNSVVETINVTATSVSGAVLIINPSNSLITAVDLYVHISPGAIIDSDNESAAFLNNNPETLNFTAMGTLSGDDEILENLIHIYPNPIINELNIKINNDTFKVEGISLYDVSGKQIEEMQLINKKVDFSKVSNGVYFLKIETNKSVMKRALVVKR